MADRPVSATGGVDTHQLVKETIVKRIATSTSRDVIDLPPFYETIDPDALNRLVHSSTATGTTVSFTFSYAGQRVTLSSDGTIRLTSREGRENYRVSG